MGDVILRDFDGNTLSTFWQYGYIDWELYYSCLRNILSSPDAHFAIFVYDENASGRHGAFCPINHQLPKPGTYILLNPDGSPLHIGLTPVSARTRHPTLTVDCSERRVRTRDPCCLISGLVNAGEVTGDFSRFNGAYIFPPGYKEDWVKKGYANLITDPAPLSELGGPTKIDSIQNVFLLRTDIRCAWDCYMFGVHPDLGYVAIPFVPGFDDIAGKVLKLDHISDPRLRPLDDLLCDHFLQCVLHNMKGIRRPPWNFESALADGIDLSRLDIWGDKTGQEHLEFELAHRTHVLEGDRESTAGNGIDSESSD